MKLLHLMASLLKCHQTLKSTFLVLIKKSLVKLQPTSVVCAHQNLIKVKVFVTLENLYDVKKVKQVNNLKQGRVAHLGPREVLEEDGGRRRGPRGEARGEQREERKEALHHRRCY